MNGQNHGATGATWGERYRLTVFGESHGPAVGVVIDGLPAGMRIDFAAVEAALARRAPGRDATATARKEDDAFEVCSGLLDGCSTGAPMMALTRNRDARSGDYETHIPRPGHADYPAHVKYGGAADMRGGGRFSGRLTAPLVFAGAIAGQYLAERYGITISSTITHVHGVTEPAAQREEILRAKAAGDSVGGVVECRAGGVPAGWGGPGFSALESVIASLMFAVPAVKGLEFGDGFGLAGLLGSEASDGLRYDGSGEVRLEANHNGGINGGISNGGELVLRVAIKPTPTIALPQRTINLKTHENVVHAFTGRHDPCIVGRAQVVLESVLAICLMEVREGHDGR
jgi:chorismate synthase